MTLENKTFSDVTMKYSLFLHTIINYERAKLIVSRNYVSSKPILRRDAELMLTFTMMSKNAGALPGGLLVENLATNIRF